MDFHYQKGESTATAPASTLPMHKNFTSQIADASRRINSLAEFLDQATVVEADNDREVTVPTECLAEVVQACALFLGAEQSRKRELERAVQDIERVWEKNGKPGQPANAPGPDQPGNLR